MSDDDDKAPPGAHGGFAHPRRWVLEEQILVLQRELDEQRLLTREIESELTDSLRRTQDVEASLARAAAAARRSGDELRAELRAAREEAVEHGGMQELREELRAARDTADRSWENQRRQRAASSLRLQEDVQKVQREADAECEHLRAELEKAKAAASALQTDGERHAREELIEMGSAKREAQTELVGVRNEVQDKAGIARLLTSEYASLLELSTLGAEGGSDKRSAYNKCEQALPPQIAELRREARVANRQAAQSEQACLAEKAQFAKVRTELHEARAGARDARACERLHRDQLIAIQTASPLWPGSERADVIPASPSDRAFPVNTADFSFAAAAERAALRETFPRTPPGRSGSCQAYPAHGSSAYPAHGSSRSPPRANSLSVRGSSRSPLQSRPKNEGSRSPPRSRSAERRSPPRCKAMAARLFLLGDREARSPPSPSRGSPSSAGPSDPLFRELVRQHALGQLPTPVSGPVSVEGQLAPSPSAGGLSARSGSIRRQRLRFLMERQLPQQTPPSRSSSVGRLRRFR